MGQAKARDEASHGEGPFKVVEVAGMWPAAGKRGLPSLSRSWSASLGFGPPPGGVRPTLASLRPLVPPPSRLGLSLAGARFRPKLAKQSVWADFDRHPPKLAALNQSLTRI